MSRLVLEASDRLELRLTGRLRGGLPLGDREGGLCQQVLPEGRHEAACLREACPWVDPEEDLEEEVPARADPDLGEPPDLGAPGGGHRVGEGPDPGEALDLEEVLARQVRRGGLLGVVRDLHRPEVREEEVREAGVHAGALL